jgi:VWFA-related protein
MAFCIAASLCAQSATEPNVQGSGTTVTKDPVLVLRPPAKPATRPSAVTPEGRIHLDVVVTDSAGKPVVGLDPWEFKLMDNDLSRRILSFRSFNGSTVKPNPPVEVILVIDTANIPYDDVSFVRRETAKFLRQNDGRLAQPVSIFQLSAAGLRIQSQASLDGNAQAAVLDQMTINLGALRSAEADLNRFQYSIQRMADIAENEARRPGRKLLIWIGPGWPMLNHQNYVYGFSEKDRQRYFDAVVELSTRIREARMAIYSVSPAVSTEESEARNIGYFKDYLKGVESARKLDTGNLALQVLAVQSGGRVLVPSNDIAGQINRCIADANTFYTLSFSPGPAQHTDEYHALKLLVDKPGVTIRTNAGYYNQPLGH